MVTPIEIRYATDEDYEKRNFYTISAVRRADPNHKPPSSSKKNLDLQDTPLDLQNLPFDPAIEAMKESRLISNKKAQ